MKRASIIAGLVATILGVGAGLALASDPPMGCGPGQVGCTAPSGGYDDSREIVPPSHDPTNKAISPPQRLVTLPSR